MRTFFLFSILIISPFGFGQTTDAQLWGEIGVKAKVGDNWSLKYESQVRFFKNVSTLRTYYNEFSADYEFLKNVEVGLGYRYSRRNRETHYEGENRVCLNLSYSKKIMKTGLKATARARYQYDFDRLSVINDVIYPNQTSTFRFKVDLAYKNNDFKRISPYVGYELFKSFKPAEVGGLDSYRLYGGLDFDLPARHEVGLRYLYEFNNGSTQNIAHCYLIQYNYALSSKLFKKKKKK